MSRLLSYPLASAALLAIWLLYNQSLSAGHLLLGCLLAAGGPRLLAVLDLPPVNVRRPQMALRLAGLVLADIMRSNIAVASILLAPGHRRRTSGFVAIPLQLRNAYGLAVLACIITSTPGTAWVSFDSAKGLLTIHVFDLIDEAEWRRIVQGRYERLLLEIFE